MKQVILLVLLVSAASSQAEDIFRYRVQRDKLLRDESGNLQIDSSGISYRSDNGKTSIHLSLADVREADVSDPGVIRIETYDVLKRRLTGRRIHTFRLTVEGHNEELARFLAANLKRPVIGAFGGALPGSFEIPAYHRHRVGGCHGKLLIDDTAIRFLSDKPSDSRTWLYRDIETIGSANDFQLRVTTLAETYNLELKDRLPEQAYEKAWQKVYRLPETASSE